MSRNGQTPARRLPREPGYPDRPFPFGLPGDYNPYPGRTAIETEAALRQNGNLWRPVRNLIVSVGILLLLGYLAWAAIILRQEAENTRGSEPPPAGTHPGPGGNLFLGLAAGALAQDWTICEPVDCSSPRCLTIPNRTGSKFLSQISIAKVCFEKKDTQDLSQGRGSERLSKVCSLNRQYSVDLYGKIVCRPSPPSLIRADEGSLRPDRS
ncbi:MAG: hypothetical protein R3335_07570 [Anaerolineales bacterium]|nr:hypothetical protein [Anaerolineales bacterium]